MSELPRLHTEPESELERSLLNAGRGYTASSSSRTKALAAVGLVGVTASSAAAASAVTKAGVAKWLVAVALVAGVAVPVARYLRRPAAAPTDAPVNVASAPAPAAVLTAPTAVAAPNSPPPATEGSTAPAAEPVSNNAPSSARAEPKPAASPLSAELGALDAARSALASGDANGALTQLDAYAHNFPHGRLSLEAEVLRIDALAKSGQTAAARKRAEAFMKRHPDSVLASRVRAYAGQ